MTNASGGPARPHRTLFGEREALTRGPRPGRRDLAEPLARPTCERVPWEGVTRMWGTRGNSSLAWARPVVGASVATWALGPGVELILRRDARKGRV